MEKGKGTAKGTAKTTVWLSRQCVICRKRTGAITRYRFFPANGRQFSAYAHERCLSSWRAHEKAKGVGQE